MDEYKNILIFGEMDGDHLLSMTAQLMRIGKELSRKMQEELCLVFLSGGSMTGVKMGYGYGADKVYTAIDPLLENYMAESYMQAMEQAIKELKPAVVLFGQNDKGMDLAPRLAFRLKTGVVLDCVDLKINDENRQLEMVKPVFGGKAYGHFFYSGGFPQIASMREGSYDQADYDESKKGEFIQLNLSLDTSRIRTKFIKKERDENLALAQNLNSANIVVSGGRGIKKKEGMDIIRKTADTLGGAIAGSRPAIDNGWLPSSLQVGLTGKKVNPQLYIAVGISGSLQHMAGCSNSKIIAAINTDESAPIFQFSHIGVVGDYQEVLQGFNDEISKFKQS